jgi:hypothetical protein
MAQPNISTTGRFSSQMLTYLGTQKTVKVVGGSIANTYKYASGTTVFPNPSSKSQATLGAGVVGSLTATAYDYTKCYFINRGSSHVYADTISAMTIDIAAMLGVSVHDLLANSEINGQMSLTLDSYSAFNKLRDPGNQLGIATSVDNRYSSQARQIRS